MPRKTRRTIYVVLGLLEQRAMSGYDIKKTLEQARYSFWRESFGQLYPTLKTLSEEGLVSMRVDAQGGGTQRKVYEITAQGREELRRWLNTTPREPSSRDEVALRVDLGAHAPPVFSVTLLEGVVRQCELKLATLYGELKQRAHDLDSYDAMGMEWTYRYLHARRRWALQCLRQLRDMDGGE